MASFDDLDYRNALACFATGVTVVTTVATDGTPAGLTVTSFNSVSLEPPLVLWSLAREAGCAPAFLDADGFAVHVLTEHQADLAQRFAATGTDRFAGLEVSAGIDGLPLLSDYSAQFQCRKISDYDGGDHVILVGEVIEYDFNDRPALAFYRGIFTGLPRDGIPPGETPG